MDEKLADAVKKKALDLGFDLVGITGAEPSAFAAEYRDWIARGCAGEMDYLARNVERRLDPREILPGARSIIAVAMNYYTDPPLNTQHQTPEHPNTQHPLPNTTAVFARYALGDDYHDIMTPRLRQLLDFLKAEAGEGAEGRVYVDTGPVLEREVARRAGLGWFGKNTMLINTRRGSYFFLGEIITNVALPADGPAAGGCGTCTRCIDACPTGAITAPYELDARRCISYLTIELKGDIRDEFQPAIAATGRIYGCDICQEVCPFNRPAATSAYPTLTPTTEPAFQPRSATTGRTLSELALLTEEEFREQFRRSAVKRTKWRGLMRNVAAARAGLGKPD
jgi:epoxyqueuosine reductase